MMDKDSIQKLAHNIVERMITNGFIGEHDDRSIDTTFEWVKDEIKERLESEVIESINLYPRVCEVTGKGMFSGFLIGGHSTLADGQDEKVLEICKEEGYKTMEEAYEDEFYCWTEWEFGRGELEEQGYCYDADGQEYNYDDSQRNWSKVV